MSDNSGIRISNDGGVTRLVIDRPTRRNALDRSAMAAMADAVVDAGRDDRTRVIVISGTGDHFCSGADLVSANPSERDRAAPRTGHLERALTDSAHRLIRTIWEVELPVVTIVRGHAAGLGCHLALAADFCVASRSAKFSEPFTRNGFTPDSAATFLLPRLVGLARAKQMLLLGKPVDGEEAARWGLISTVVDDKELDHEAEAVVGELASGATVAIGLAKQVLHRNLGADIVTSMANEGMTVELSIRGRDFKEGIAAFKEKRRPEFTGE